jgi:predicted dehydrogenase/threonine dehydrogenase-like Zn-dependent dehydrogenase
MQALLKTRHEGISALWAKARNTVDREGLCGYSAAGTVIDVGEGVEGFVCGMNVAITGSGHANHAEICRVPRNLAVPVPDGVSLVDACTVALGAIALQGIRRAQVSVGDQVAVIGCGALGMLALQMLKAAGCRVFAADLDARRLELSTRLGADATGNPGTEDVVAKAMHWSGGHGVDAVLVMAATSSGEPLSQAFRMSRRRGRVVLVGVAGGEYKRADMYAKELDFVISTSYGPGRYDDNYELDGHDYPYGYVRWTENRNMHAYLQLIASGSVQVAQLIEVRRPLHRADEAYEALASPIRPLLAIIEYNGAVETVDKADYAVVSVSPSKWVAPLVGHSLGLGIVGVGSFVQAMHAPILTSAPTKFAVRYACSRSGTSARAMAAKTSGCRETTRIDEVLESDQVDAVLIGTRHDSHAAIAIRALRAGKGAFLEKPMCIKLDDFKLLQAAVENSSAPFMVGYNRRFSPFAETIRREAASRIQPMMIQYTMNAGFLPADHWTQGPEGGGRLMGEACHIVDLFRSLVGSPVVSVSCEPIRSTKGALPTDNFTLVLAYQDGSVASLVYTALGHRDYNKESMRVFFDEKVLVMDDYLELVAYGAPHAAIKLKSQDKGHRQEWDAFRASVLAGNRFAIPWEELMETWRVCYAADQICRRGEPIL